MTHKETLEVASQAIESTRSARESFGKICDTYDIPEATIDNLWNLATKVGGMLQHVKNMADSADLFDKLFPSTKSSGAN